MAFFNGWPWANFQEQNLDWIIRKIKELAGNVEELTAWIEDLKQTVHNDVAIIMDEWLNDGTIDQIVANAVKYKAWMFPSLSDIPADITLEVGDTVTTGTAMYMVAASGIPVGNYYFYPVSYTYATDLGLNADGVSNDRSMLNTLLTILPVIDLKGATIFFNGSQIAIPNNRVIKNGCIRWGSSTGIAFNADGISNVLFDTVEFDCSGSPILGKKISLTNTNNLIFNNCYIHDWFGTFARLNGAQNLKILNTRVSTSTGDVGDDGAAFYLQGGSNIIYNNVQGEGLSGALFYIDGSAPVYNVDISNIIAKTLQSTFSPHAITIYGDATRVNITNIVIDDCNEGIGVRMRASLMPKQVNISNVTIYNPLNGIDIRADGPAVSTTQVNITNVSIYNATQDGVILDNVKGVNISSSFIDARRSGIRAYNSSGCIINNCNLVMLDNANTCIRLDADCSSFVISACVFENTTATNYTAIQDLNTANPATVIIAPVFIGLFVAYGTDTRNAVLLFPTYPSADIGAASVMYGNATYKPSFGVTNGTQLIDTSGASNGWRRSSGAWVAK